MTRLALTALATLALGTGCYVDNGSTGPRTGTGTLDLAWQFRGSDGLVAGHWTAADSGCDAAVITDVDLSLIDGGGARILFQNYPCQESGTGLPRAYASGLPSGRFSYLATAYRQGSPVFTDNGSIVISDGLVTSVDATLDVVSPAPLTVYFDQRGSLTCNGTPNVRYDLFTAGGTLIETRTLACDPVSGGFTVTADQPTGFTYQLDLYAIDGAGRSVNEMCRVNVVHDGFPVLIDLLQAPQPSCG